MEKKDTFQISHLSFNRRAVIASASVTRKKNTIHGFTEVDISHPKKLLDNYFASSGEKLSLTAYIVACLARTIKDHPDFNSFIRGRKQVRLNDLTISVLVEKDIDSEKVPEPIGIKQAQDKTLLQIHEEIRTTKSKKSDKLGSLSEMSWIRFIPGFLLKLFVRLADRNTQMALRYGKVAVTAIGMFSSEGVWFIPHGSATVLITVGSISPKVVETDGQFLSREHLCLTASFDHNIVDGGPAARFIKQFSEIIKSGDILKAELNIQSSQ